MRCRSFIGPVIGMRLDVADQQAYIGALPQGLRGNFEIERARE
jgi:hypothetical protein